MTVGTHCSVRQYSDQMYCSICRLTWDTNDQNPPVCKNYKSVEIKPTDSPVKYLQRFGRAERKSYENWKDGKLKGAYGDWVRSIPENKIDQRKEIALIGFLAAKLACYEPDSEQVKDALEYLKNVRS